MTHKTIGGKELVEWSDIFSVSSENYLVLNSDFYKLLNKYFLTSNNIKSLVEKQNEFLTKSELTKLNNLFSETETLKKELLKQLSVFNEMVKKELADFKKEIEKLKKDMNDFVEGKKQELSKKFIFEISDPISDKNKAIKNTLIEFHKEICNGIDEYKYKDNFIEQFKKIIPELDLNLFTKRYLLEYATNEKYWKRGDDTYENDFSNSNIDHALRKLINDISAGCEANKLEIYQTSDNKIGFRLIEKQKKETKTKQDIKEIEESEEQEESEESDIYGN